MKNIINQFYSEGLATTFYVRPIRYFEKKIKNKKVLKVFEVILKIIYTVLVLLFAIYMFYIKFPL